MAISGALVEGRVTAGVQIKARKHSQTVTGKLSNDERRWDGIRARQACFDATAAVWLEWPRRVALEVVWMGRGLGLFLSRRTAVSGSREE